MFAQKLVSDIMLLFITSEFRRIKFMEWEHKHKSMKEIYDIKDESERI
jgi:hypothetical protein